MNILEYVFVGAGMANLAAARRLIDSGVSDVLLLERGSALDQRMCPGVKPQTCFFCEQGCSILSGLGGTDALYGNKLCYFPASSSILGHFSGDALDCAWRWLHHALSGYFDSSQNRKEVPSDSLSRKHYRSVVLSRSEFRGMVRNLLAPLTKVGALRSNCNVKSVRRDGSIFTMETDTGAIHAKRVILGTGRSGIHFLRRVCGTLGISVSENHQDIGIRIEAPQTFFSRFYSYQEDPKLKLQSSFGIMRTFCGENRGMIVPVVLDDAFFAEGAYPEPFSDKCNVALMVRSNMHLSHDHVRAWCKSVNSNQGGSLVTATLDAREATANELMTWITENVPRMPSSAHRSLLLKLLEVLGRTETSLFRNDGRLTGNVRIFGPAVDNYWPRPEVGQNLETRVPNLFILGDAVGVSRGYVQALTAGAAWASQHIAMLSPGARASTICHASE